MPTDVKLKERWQWDVDGLGSAMTTLELDDVVPASEKELAADQVVKAEVETFGGLIVKIAMVPDGEHTWATFSAEVNAEAKAEPEGEDEERIRTARGGQERGGRDQRPGEWLGLTSCPTGR